MPATNHEAMHPVGTEPAWSESYYFNFVDPDAKLAMFTRMGFRPGDGWADALHVVYLEGSRVAFTYGRRDIEADLTTYDGDLTVGGLSIVCDEPHGSWTIRYDGPAQDIADGAILLERRKERPDGWYRPATLDMSMTFDCTSPPHFTSSEDGSTGAYGHFEQAGRVHGQIRLDDQQWSADGFGVRDKSWGPRDWGAGQRDEDSAEDGAERRGPTFSTPDAPQPFVNWFSMNFGTDALGGAAFLQPDGRIRGGGWIQRGGETVRLRGVEIETDYRGDSILHRGVRLTATIEDGEDITITGHVLNMCPTKVPMRNGATFINEGLAEFRWGDRTGYGIAEHWHAVQLG